MRRMVHNQFGIDEPDDNACPWQYVKIDRYNNQSCSSDCPPGWYVENVGGSLLCIDDTPSDQSYQKSGGQTSQPVSQAGVSSKIPMFIVGGLLTFGFYYILS